MEIPHLAIIGVGQCRCSNSCDGTSIAQAALASPLFALTAVRPATPPFSLCGYLDSPCQRGRCRPSWLRQRLEEQPLLPVIPLTDLHPTAAMESFKVRALAYADWQQLRTAGMTRASLTAFHARYKYQLMAISPVAYQRLGRTIAENGDKPLAELARYYFEQLMACLATTATRGGHTNALQHLAGYLKRALTPAEKQALQELIAQYRAGAASFAAPVALLLQHFAQHPNDYISQQAYLQLHRPGT